MTSSVLHAARTPVSPAFVVAPFQPFCLCFPSSLGRTHFRSTPRVSQTTRASLPTHIPGDISCLPLSTPWAESSDQINPHNAPLNNSFETDLSSGEPPYGGSSSGGKGGDDDGNEDATAILRRYGRTEDLTPDLSGLSTSQLKAYLEATSHPFPAWLSKIWPGFRRRVAADPDFPFKLLMEETMGLGLAASGMIAARGKNILSELDFAFCDIAVGGTLNFLLVYLLTPAIGASQGRFAALPANVFSQGSYSLMARTGTFFYKGSVFAACGFAGSLLGTSLAQTLIFGRRAVKKMRGVEGGTEKVLPNVGLTSLAWAGFMLVSSNPRYQTLAGFERVLFGMAPEKVAKVGSAALRAGNNVMGGANWVWWARFIGLQQKSE